MLAQREDERERNKALLAIRLKNMDLSKPSDRERMIREVMQSEKVSYDDAAAFVNKTVVLRRDPVTDEEKQFNVITGREVVKSGQQPEAAPTGAGAAPPGTGTSTGANTPPSATPPKTLWDITNNFRTGILPGAGALLQGVTGQVGIDVVPKGFIEDRQAFANASGALIRALAINARLPVSEMERITQELNVSPGFFTDTRSLRERMRSLDNHLNVRLSNEERAAQDRTLPKQERQFALTNANSIRNFLVQLGVPSRNASGAPSGQNNIPPAPSGVPGNLWRAMTPEDRALWQN